MGHGLARGQKDQNREGDRARKKLGFKVPKTIMLWHFSYVKGKGPVRTTAILY